MNRVYCVVVTLLAILFSTVSLSAQSVSNMRAQLAKRTVDGACVNVTEDSLSAEAVEAVDALAKPSKFNGYRVVIYFDNGQGANDKASYVLNSFRSKYPHINAYMVYESPYFKVSVGDCLTMEEALILMHSISGDYPKAFPKREEIKVGTIQSVRKRSLGEGVENDSGAESSVQGTSVIEE